ncbi:hypothetical protein C8J57DRAFT_1461463 [Mycena rebaudengoi]|nr:hypothetical protein C8J57DRAFT_1461463 [Mycena rebaudengoi]
MAHGPIIDDNPDDVWTVAHMDLHRAYCLFLVRDDPTETSLELPRTYNSWTYQLRVRYGNIRGLPPFSRDYTGDIPGLAPPLQASIGGQAPANISNDNQAFLVRFAESQLSVASEATRLLMEQARSASRYSDSNRGRARYRRGRGHGHRNSRRSDSYFSESNGAYHTGGSYSGKRQRSRTPDNDDRRTRPRRYSPSVSPDRTERGRSPERGRPNILHRSSRSLEADARTAHSNERAFKKLQEEREQDLFERTLRARKAPLADSDVLMTSVRGTTSLLPAAKITEYSGKGKGRHPQDGPGFASNSGASTSSSTAPTTTTSHSGIMIIDEPVVISNPDLDPVTTDPINVDPSDDASFYESLWATDDNGEYLPRLPESESGEIDALVDDV